MSEAPQTTYDQIAYLNQAFFYTHPNWMATVATVFGLTPPPTDRCRVLDLGCATGGNVLPMAESLPGGRFVGIDLSHQQIASGQAVVDALQLPNVELKALSIMDVDESFGQFDYIICHGVYSWVPPAVQDKILAICAERLAPNGVAYVSYNTYPGWHLRSIVRDMLHFHAGQFADLETRLSQARGFLDFLVRATEKSNPLYKGILQHEAKLLAGVSDTYFFHEHLEEVNEPLYFYQFAERAAAHGLRYLAEARFNPMAANLAAELKEAMAQLSPDPLYREQYFDFLNAQTFRRTLLCHEHAPGQRRLVPDILEVVRATGLLQPVSAQPDIHSNALEEFRTSKGLRLTSNRPLVKAALCILAEMWPRSLSLDALWDQVRDRLGPTLETDPGGAGAGRRAVAELLWQCYFSNLVEFYLHEVPFVLAVSERPTASPLARLQAATGTEVTNRRHRSPDLTAFDRLVLRHLDGTRDRAALRDVLADLAAKGAFTIQRHDQPVQDTDKVRAILNEGLEASLKRLARGAFLIG
jgi:methyltransferase-like protein/SAM-dependent methyltransferase